MNFKRLFLGSSLALFLFPPGLGAQEMQPHKHEMGEKLGRVNFAVS